MTKCAICGTDNRDTARFCSKCGTTLAGYVPLQPGAIVQGRYAIVSILGQGGMGAVYLAEDQQLYGKRWALKELLDALADPAARVQAVQLFQQEVKLLATLSHPNLPHISDYFVENNRHYLVMEYVDGDILDVIQNKTSGFLAEAQVIGWAIQVCEALEYLHKQTPPIVFRDLKPANIMLDKGGRIKLIDFGIARFFRPGKAKDTIAMGTPGYAAPEQHGVGQTDARSDVYALGATLHCLLTNRDPAAQPFTFPPCQSLNPALSTTIATIIVRATAIDPVQRYQTIGELKQALLSPTVMPNSQQPYQQPPQQLAPQTYPQPAQQPYQQPAQQPYQQPPQQLAPQTYPQPAQQPYQPPAPQPYPQPAPQQQYQQVAPPSYQPPAQPGYLPLARQPAPSAAASGGATGVYPLYGRRAVAFLFDMLIFSVVVVLFAITMVAPMILMLQGKGDQVPTLEKALAVIVGLITVVFLVWYPVILPRRTGRTLGKYLMHVKIVDLKTRAVPGMGKLAVRFYIGYPLSAIILGVGFLIPLWDSQKQALHDKLVNTVVVEA